MVMPGFPQFDPSKMDPKVMMELSRLVQQLPPDQLNRMQSIMHNSMAGFDVRAEVEAFEKGLPPGFREKMVALMTGAGMGPGMGMPGMATPSASSEIVVDPVPTNEREARLTVLRAVASGEMSPEEAEALLFTGK